jgi:NitT/TauT family transport system permease protein
MGDITPEFRKGDAGQVAITNLSAFAQGGGARTRNEVIAIALVAIIVVGGLEILLRLFEVKSYILPKPSEVALAYYTDFRLVLPHLGHTLAVLGMGFSIGAVVGMVLAAVITQFPFVEKIIAPYILVLVTTPMLALVPLLILRFGFGYTPRVIAVALAAGPMVMINAATGFRRVDSAKIALARSYGASTLQIFWKVRAPMALPMILVGLMIGAIFGLLTAVGAEMVGGGFGLGNRLTTYSSMIQMPQFFAVVLMLSALGILIYVIFFLIGKKYASWEA